MTLLPFEGYVATLSQLSSPFDPTIPTTESEHVRAIAHALGSLDQVDRDALATLVSTMPDAVPVLGLAVGLTREKLKNVLRHHLGSAAWNKLARSDPEALVALLDQQYGLVRLLTVQRGQSYDFGDILVARAGTRHSAMRAGAIGRQLEDEIERAVLEFGLPYETRTRFTGRGGLSAPCDLAIPGGGAGTLIAIAAKGFDSTGSKLTDAVREIEEMAERRLPTQYVMAVVDGIGWKNRLNDLRKVHSLRESDRIDGLYSLRMLDDLRRDLQVAARRLGLIV